MLFDFSRVLSSAACLVLLAGRVLAIPSEPLDRTNWKVSASSSQSGSGPENAIDNKASTIWIASDDGKSSHTLTIDMGGQHLVGGFAYTPRQDGSTDGHVNAHTIQLSVDGKKWTTVAKGTYASDKRVKNTFFSHQPARFVRLESQADQNNTGNLTSAAAEVNVLSPPMANLDRSGWSVTASSEETGGGHYFTADEAIDGAITTYWQTQFTGGTVAFPHYLTIDQGGAKSVAGMTVLPRPPSSGKNGNIGQYQIQRSDDGNTWTNVSSGTWPDDNNLHVAQFSAVTARFFRLVALSEAGNRGDYTSAADVNLLDGSVHLSDFTATADTQVTSPNNHAASMAIDGDANTYWQSGNGFPHYITIDMKRTLYLRGMDYTPYQDSVNGRVGQHQVEVSTDNANWKTVATGNFQNDTMTKHMYFSETAARYIRFTIKSMAFGGQGSYTVIPDLSPVFDSGFTPNPATQGQWGETIDFPVVPVAGAILPQTGRFIGWSSYFPGRFTGGLNSGVTWFSTYDPATGVVTVEKETAAKHDMFCPGISMTANGEPFVTGGNNANKTSVYRQGAWAALATMNIPRGYQSSAILSDGRIFTIGGSFSGGRGGKIGEVYSPSTGRWTILPGAIVSPMLTKDTNGIYRADNHGWLFGWKQNTVFQAGPSSAMHWYTMAGRGAVVNAGNRGNDPDSMCGNAVMYDAFYGKILTLGGSTSYENVTASSNANIITLGAVNGTAQVQSIGNMHFRRALANSVALPDGNVFTVGGQDYPRIFTDDTAHLTPELWNMKTQQFTLMAPQSIPRAYHSIALLMPDGRIISAGGGLCDVCSYNHFDAQIFSPPYLFNSDGSLRSRPAINSVSATAFRPGAKLTVTTSVAVTRFAMMRYGANTHTVNTDQRRIDFPTPQRTSGNSYVITVPADPGVTLPGYYMLFALDSNGTPSVSKTVQVTL